MGTLFDGNYREYEDKLTVYLSRKIFGDPVKCCLEAAKPGKAGEEQQCQYFDTEDHKYMRKIANAFDEVQDVSKMLNMAPVFINSYSVSSLWSKYFDQSGYLKYHIENWYINVIRLEDMFLILVNEVFRLGIRKEHINYEMVSTNENLPDLIKKNLKSLHKAIKPIRAARIMLIHHQTLYESKLYDIEKDEKLVKLLRNDDKLAEALNDISFFAKKFKVPRYRANKRDYMLRSNKALLEYISEMLLLMEGHFTVRYNELLVKR